MNAGRLFPLSLRGGACVTSVGKGVVVMMDQWWRGGVATRADRPFGRWGRRVGGAAREG